MAGLADVHSADRRQRTESIAGARRRPRPVSGSGPVERVKGIEPSFSAWEADVLPLNYTRLFADSDDSMALRMKNRDETQTSESLANTGMIRRLLMPGGKRIVSIWVLCFKTLLINGCALFDPRPLPTQQEGHLAESAPAALPSPVRHAPPLPAPPPLPESEHYTVSVHEVPVRELLFSLAQEAGLNLDVHAQVQGNVTLNALDQPLSRILDRIVSQLPIRYESRRDYLAVLPDTPFFRTYPVDYLNLARKTGSSIRVTTQIESTGTAAGGETQGTDNNSTTSVSGTIELDFWNELKTSVEALLADARESGTATAVIPQPMAGLIAVRATERLHRVVRRFLDEVLKRIRRQVLIRVTIVEVALNDRYQAGIEWSLISEGFGLDVERTALGPLPPSAISSLVLDYDDRIAGGTFNATLRLLEEFGETRVLSSPQLMALNNQTALLKVVDNLVYFTVEQQSTLSVQGSSENTSRSEVHTVPVGVVMSVTPQIDEYGQVMLSVRPSISRINRFVSDPNPALTGQGNRIPEIQVRELESILSLKDGQVAVLGGLIQDERVQDRNSLPFFSRLPWIAPLFNARTRQAARSELVILLRPTVVHAAPQVSAGRF